MSCEQFPQNPRSHTGNPHGIPNPAPALALASGNAGNTRRYPHCSQCCVSASIPACSCARSVSVKQRGGVWCTKVKMGDLKRHHIDMELIPLNAHNSEHPEYAFKQVEIICLGHKNCEILLK